VRSNAISTASKTKAYPHLTVIAALLAMMGPFTIDTYLPAFPEIETSFVITRAMLSQSMGFYLAAFAISTLFWGPLADRLGRRFVILTSVGLYVIASAACAMAEVMLLFLLASTVAPILGGWLQSLFL